MTMTQSNTLATIRYGIYIVIFEPIPQIHLEESLFMTPFFIVIDFLS